MLVGQGDINRIKTGFVSAKSYGATGNGTTDDLAALNRAIAANSAISIPAGTYRVSAPLEIPFGKKVVGDGYNTIIKADNVTYDAVRLPAGSVELRDVRIQNGNNGLLLFGRDGVCVQNTIQNIIIEDSNYGITLDGYTDTNKPCYWNEFSAIFVRRPKIHGVYLTKSGAGDTPNANKFHNVRVQSLGSALTGNGIYVEYGKYNNSFFDCEANISTSGGSCIRIGSNSDKTLLVNPYTETSGANNNVQLDAGSVNTSIINLLSVSAGAAISDSSGGNYTTFNSGSPVKNYMPNIQVGHPLQVVSNTLTPVVQTHGLDSNTANWGVYRYSNNNVGARINLCKTRSTTIGNQGLVQNNDVCGYIDFNGSDNSQIRASSSIQGSVDATVTAGTGIVPGRVTIHTVNASGTLTEAMRVDSKQNVVNGTGAIATTATDGFTYIATCAGTPTGVPTSYSGRVPMVYDTTANKFWIYNGSWRGVVLS